MSFKIVFDVKKIAFAFKQCMWRMKTMIRMQGWESCRKSISICQTLMRMMKSAMFHRPRVDLGIRDLERCSVQDTKQESGLV